MSETLPVLRVLLLGVGDAPPLEAAPEGAPREGPEWTSVDLEAFLADLDGGEPLPDLVLIPGGDPLALRALRGHPRACCLPVYAIGATPPGAAGWDGVLTSWTEETVERARALRAAAGTDPSLEPLDSQRRAHGFARFLASRGRARAEDAKTFGVSAPRSLFAAWEQCGWIETSPEGEVLARPALGEAARWSRLSDPAASPSPEVVAEEPAPVAEEPAPVAEEPAPVPALAPTPERRRWLLPAAALLVLAVVGARAAAEAGLVSMRGPMAWLAGGTATSVPWEPPRPDGPRLRVPAHDAGVAARLAAGDPAFRPRPAVGASPTSEPAPNTTADPTAPVAPAQPEEPVAAPVTPPAPPAVPVVPPPPTALEVPVRLETERATLTFPRDAGRVLSWSVAVGEHVAAGAILAELGDAEVEARAAELEALRAGFAEQRAREHAAREGARQRELARLRAQAGLAAGAAESAATRVAEREQLHTRNLQLVESGVLGYGEIRADWDALLQARAEAEQRDLEAQTAHARVADLEAAGGGAVPGPGPAEALLLSRLERGLSEAREALLLRAPVAGTLLGPRAATGIPLARGAVLAALQADAPRYGVVQLAPGEAAWLDARLLLQPADGVRVPIPDFEVRRATDGGWELRFRWPAAIAADAAAILSRGD